MHSPHKTVCQLHTPRPADAGAALAAAAAAAGCTGAPIAILQQHARTPLDIRTQASETKKQKTKQKTAAKRKYRTATSG
jgi:hypothetical protein